MAEKIEASFLPAFWNEEKPLVFFDGDPVSFHWSDEQQTGKLQLILAGEHQLIIQRKKN